MTALAGIVYRTGDELVARFKLVKECEADATRIKTQALLLARRLEDAPIDLKLYPGFADKLEELNGTLEHAKELEKVRSQRFPPFTMYVA